MASFSFQVFSLCLSIVVCSSNRCINTPISNNCTTSSAYTWHLRSGDPNLNVLHTWHRRLGYPIL